MPVTNHEKVVRAAAKLTRLHPEISVGKSVFATHCV